MHHRPSRQTGARQTGSRCHFSRKIHAQMVDGKAYGFAFDDVGAHEALVHEGNPQVTYITLDPFN